MSLGAANSSGPALWVGLDVGGTKIEGIAVDERQEVRSHVYNRMDAANAGRAAESIHAAIRQALAEAGTGRHRLQAIGAGVPGMVQAGVVRNAVNLKMTDFPLAESLAAEFGAPAFLENDVRTAALGVYEWQKQRQPVENLAYLSIGTGIAAGIILHGRLYRGSNGMAGEVGHIIVEPGGLPCPCGVSGCLETIASGPGMVRQAQLVLQSGGPSLLRQADPLTAEAIFQAGQAGDVVARQVLDKAGAYLGRAIYSLLMTYDVDRVFLGGGVAKAGDAFLAPIQAYLGGLRQGSRLASDMLPPGKVSVLPADFNPGLWGAVALARSGQPVAAA